jgi:hypothetical protein
MAMQPGPQLLGAHPVDARGTGVLLDASERQGEILAGEKVLPEARLGGVRSGVARRRGWAALSAGGFGLHPLHPCAPRPLAGLAAIIVHPASTSVLRLGFAFGPSRRPAISPVIRPLLTSPRRTETSRSRLSLATRRSTPTAWTGIPGHPRRPPRVRPTTFVAHPPRLRNGPLMASGFASWCRLARAAPPSTRRATRPRTIPMPHVFLGSRLRTPASSPPSLTTERLPSACGWCHQPPQGTRTPELLVMSRAHRACGSPAHGSPTSFTGWQTQAWVSPSLSGDGRRAGSPTGS